ncbi:Molecular chaperone (DnaJ superfamily) [Ceraceosorus bombacis]|uniref:Molecular chaperone (DnaJ superfamily) n=1 Tax=Ceraceosorus bombacis TaxID=401625 RepID=A0A0P1BHX5_9BASI|nr:Molecular chaperone (DnaJ superfamily) [Ceraceosorus bombacis]
MADEDVVMTDAPNVSGTNTSGPSRHAGTVSEAAKAEAATAKDKGNDAFRAGQHDEAIRLYTQAIDSNPQEPSYYTNRAAAYMSKKQFKLALSDCQQAAALQSSSPQAKTLIRLARCHFSLGELDAADTVLSQITDAGGIDPGLDAAKSLQQQVRSTRSHLETFRKSLEAKDWSHAQMALSQAERAVSEVPVAWRLLRAELLLRKGDMDGANGSVSDVLRLDSNQPDALFMRARILCARGTEMDKAVKTCQAALRSDPEHAGARALLKRCRKLEAVKNEANEAFKKGSLQEAIKLYTDALQAADEAISAEGEVAGFKALLYSNRATANYKLEKYREAITDCDGALNLNPGYSKALRTRARSKLKNENYEEAVRDFKAAVEESQASGNATELNALKQELRSAEADLKRSKKKDYYKILGVPKDASSADIKKAYRKESLKHHPDKGGDEEKFKLTNEAFSVLSDDQKRKRHDMGADDPESDSPFGGGGGGGFPAGGFHFSNGGGGAGGPDINLADLFGGGFPPGFGGAGMGGSSFAGAGGPFGGAGPSGGTRRQQSRSNTQNPPGGFQFNFG